MRMLFVFLVCLFSCCIRVETGMRMSFAFLVCLFSCCIGVETGMRMLFAFLVCLFSCCIGVETGMRMLFAFLVCLFSFWTWKDFFLRWLRTPASHPSSRATTERLLSQDGQQGFEHPSSRATTEHLLSQDGQQGFELARFLSSLPEDERRCNYLVFDGDWIVKIYFGRFDFTLIHGTGTGMLGSYCEFLEAVASSKIVFHEKVNFEILGSDFFKHVEAFADALCRSNNKFKKLILQHYNGPIVRIAKCLSSLLLKNDAIQDLDLYFAGVKEEMDKKLAMELIAIIGVPHILQILKTFRMDASKLDGEEMEQFMKPFQRPSSVLEEFRFSSLSSDAHFEHISGVLASSTSLKTLWMYNGSTKVQKVFTRGYSSIATTLCSNQSLESLSCDISSSMELKVLLDPLMPKNNNLQRNTTLTKLQLWISIREKEGIETLVDLIHTNTSLLVLSLYPMDNLSLHDTQETENVLAILKALGTNKSLKRIGFPGCKAVGGYKVLGAMMDLLLENHNIEDIDLTSTSLNESGDADYIYSALSRRKKMKLWDIVQSMAIANPKSGRVFLCGQPLAGKTRLRMSMKQLKEFQQKDEIPNQSRIKEKRRKIFKTSNEPKVPIEDMPLKRTHGIEVESVLCDGIGITIWDMAGQTDYHSFHELVMPNLSADGSSSMFLLMCNPMEQSTPSKRRSPSNIKLELEWWLRFIASNTRRSLSYLPHVSIVMTHLDYWKDDHAFATRIDDVVVELKSQFQEVLEFDEDKSVFKVDGRDVSHARMVFDFMKSHMKALLERLPKTMSACEEVQHLVALWNADKSKPPLLKWEEFCEGLCKEVEELNDVNHELANRKKEFVAISLNDGGHIIYNEKEGVVITNPHWFCHHIIGQFLHQCAIQNCDLEIVSANGIISMAHMKRLILQLVGGQGDMEKQFDDILSMMMKLHVCYKQDASSIMIPSTLKDKHESLKWCSNDDSTSLKHVGRRLACKDGVRTILTPGFFVRLQVSFFQKLESKNVQDSYEVFQDIITFISGGIEVILQFHHGDIDILLRSHQCEDKMLEFLETEIVMHIKHLQVDPTLGCPGVCLIEYILRPACVRTLVHAKDRKNQCVQVKDLEAEVIKIGVDATHNWKSCEGLGKGYNKVSTLLGGLAWKNLLGRRSRDLQDYHKKIQSLKTMTLNDQSNSNNDSGRLWTTSLWQMPQRLVYGPLIEEIVDLRREHREYHIETMSKLDNVVHLIQNLEHNIENMQGELLLEVCSKIDDVMEFSLEMQKSQIPKLAYLCEFGKRKLLTRLVPGLDRIQLHLMCESIHGFHEVPNQEGCVVYFGTEHTRRFLAMVAWGLKIATLLTKIGAHVACGMGAMVPDFSNGGSFVALILDTPGFLDYQIPTTILESLPSDVMKQSRISVDDHSEAQQWLQEFLEPKCQDKRDFYKQFGLKKVRYTRARGTIAWICDKCISMHHNDIDELK